VGNSILSEDCCFSYPINWLKSSDTVEAYRDEATAQARAEFFRQDSNPEYDDIGVAEIEIGKHDGD
jgi:hypothetical protein